MISGDDHVKYCDRNGLDNTECIYVILLNIKGLSH